MTSNGRTALYRLYDASGQLLYAGIAANPKERWEDHAAKKPWWPEVARRDVEWFATREAAEAAEQDAIVAERPRHNAKHALPELSAAAVEELFAEYKQALETERALRPRVQAAAAQELRVGVKVGQLAKLTGMTAEVFRRIARAEGVERLREPTVGKDAKPRAAE